MLGAVKNTICFLVFLVSLVDTAESYVVKIKLKLRILKANKSHLIYCRILSSAGINCGTLCKEVSVNEEL